MDPTSHTLDLLALLQSRPEWTAAELAARLGTSGRTLRRDLTRLRELGYAVEGRPGPGGSYALRAGTRIPPLLFDDEEVATLVAALRMAEDRLAGDVAARALAKLVRILPSRPAATAVAVRDGTAAIRPDGAAVDPAALVALAQAGAVEFGYVDQAGVGTRRKADSVQCLHSRGQWYLLAFDLDRDDWRCFRLDRVTDVRVTGPGEEREGPAADLVSWLESDFGRHSPVRTPGPAAASPG